MELNFIPHAFKTIKLVGGMPKNLGGKPEIKIPLKKALKKGIKYTDLHEHSFLYKLLKTFIGGFMGVSFTQHTFSPTIKIIGGMPKIEISRKALEDMAYLVEKTSTEISWLGTVDVRGDDPTSAIYHIDEIFVIDQQVTGGETEMSEKGLSEFGDEMSRKKNGVSILNRLYFWGHSHVNMGTTASSTDVNQMDLFKSNDREFFIRGIFNKAGRAQFSIFLYAENIEFHDVEWSSISPLTATRKEFLDKEMTDKVHAKTYSYSNYDYRNNFARNTSITSVARTEDKSKNLIKFETLDRNDERLRIRGGTGNILTYSGSIPKITEVSDPAGGDALDGLHGDAMLPAHSATEGQQFLNRVEEGLETKKGAINSEFEDINNFRGRFQEE